MGTASDSFDVAALERWIDGRLPGEGPLEAERVSAGASNEIFELRRDGGRWILRCPPRALQNPEARNKIMLREFRVLSALRGSEVPHPEPLLVCDDPAVIGVNFYVMEHIDGFAPRDPLPAPFDSDPAARRRMGEELVDRLADLALVDWRAAGLDGFGKPEGFLERQVERWLSQLATYRTREIPGLDEVSAWLGDHVPKAQEPAIIHGDYQFINTMFAHGAPARLAAIVDWEQATIGDPLLDLGWLIAGWADPSEEPRSRFASGYFASRDGLPTRAELIERYARRTGLPVDGLDYYVVLAMFKLGCVLEGGYALFLSGRSKNAYHETFGEIVLRVMRDAATIAARN